MSERFQEPLAPGLSTPLESLTPSPQGALPGRFTNNPKPAPRNWGVLYKAAEQNRLDLLQAIMEQGIEKTGEEREGLAAGYFLGTPTSPAADSACKHADTLTAPFFMDDQRPLPPTVETSVGTFKLDILPPGLVLLDRLRQVPYDGSCGAAGRGDQIEEGLLTLSLARPIQSASQR